MSVELPIPYTLPPQFPPAWAEGWGEDDFGVFAGLPLGEEIMEMRWIPPGRFMMGSPEDENGRHEDEGPQHEVTISQGFWLACAPCTQAQWRALDPKRPDPSSAKGDRLPVEQVRWDDCAAACARLSQSADLEGLAARLPTEAEWEYACRAGAATAFNDGSGCSELEGKDKALEKLGWYWENSGNQTHEVMGKVPNRWGLYDMHGNVVEWCQDWKSEYVVGTVVDPQGPDTGGLRVLRGGGYWSSARRCRSAYRYGYAPGNRGGLIGFRLALGQSLSSSRQRSES